MLAATVETDGTAAQITDIETMTAIYFHADYRMGLRQKNNCDWDKNAGEIRLLFCPSVCPKASREINSFGTVFCLKLGQSNLSEYLEIERKFVSVWDKV